MKIREKVQNPKIQYSRRLLGILAAETVIAILLGRLGIGKENILMVFMVGVLMTAAWTDGYQYGIIGAVVSVMLFNYLFTIPIHTFAIMNPNDVALMGFFLIASFICSSLTARFQRQLLISKKNEETARQLYEMSEGFINVTGKENIIEFGIQRIYEYTKYESAVELSDDIVVGRSGTEYISGDYLMFPIIGLVKRIGVLKVFNHKRGLTSEEELMVKTAANQIGIALDRELIYAEQEKIKVEVDREHMKSSMLRSISHDFRTPLTGIIGDCDVILRSDELEEPQVRQLVEEISEQSMWLMKMMENILNMTKIESGQNYIEKQEEVVDDIVYASEKRVIGLKKKRKFSVSLPEEVILIDVDSKMMSQVIINLLDNAVKHTEEGGKITLDVSYRNKKAYFKIEDDGEGFDERMKNHIFEEFVSLTAGSDHKRGIGLGLAICKEVVSAHGGEIWAENRSEGGARFVFWIKARKVGADGR